LGYAVEKQHASHTLEDSVYIPRRCGGVIEVLTYQDELLISNRSYRYPPPPDIGCGSIDIFHSIRMPFMENEHSTMNCQDSRIRLITINDDKNGEDAETIDSIASLWQGGLTKNYRLLCLENQDAIEDSRHYGVDLETALSNEFKQDKGASSPTQRELLICLSRRESIAPSALINSDSDASFPQEYDSTLLEKSAGKVKAEMTDYQCSKFEAGNIGYSWSILEPVVVPLISGNNGRMENRLKGYCYKLSRQSGGPSEVANWRIPGNLNLLEASKWQLRHFLFEQCFLFGVDWQSEELYPYLSFKLLVQLFVPPDEKGRWLLFVSAGDKRKPIADDIADVLTISWDYDKVPISSGFCRCVKPDTVRWKPLALKFRIPHEDLEKYDDMECRFFYDPNSDELHNDDDLDRNTRKQPQVRFKLCINQTNDDEERTDAFDSSKATGRGSGKRYLYPRTWEKAGFSPPTESDVRRSYRDRGASIDSLKLSAERRRWRLTSILSAVVDYRYESGNIEQVDTANSDIRMHVFQNFAAPERFGRDLQFYLFSGATLILSLFNFIIYFFRTKNGPAVSSEGSSAGGAWSWIKLKYANIRSSLIKLRDDRTWKIIVTIAATAINLYIYPYLPLDVVFLEESTFFVVLFFVLCWAADRSRYSGQAQSLRPWFTRPGFTSFLLLVVSAVTALYAVLNWTSLWLGILAHGLGITYFAAAVGLAWTGVYTIIATRELPDRVSVGVDHN